MFLYSSITLYARITLVLPLLRESSSTAVTAAGAGLSSMAVSPLSDCVHTLTDLCTSVTDTSVTVGWRLSQYRHVQGLNPESTGSCTKDYT
jgi:hypothetical protein